MSDTEQAPPKKGWSLRVHAGKDLVEIILDEKRIEMTKQSALFLAEKIQFHLAKAVIQDHE